MSQTIGLWVVVFILLIACIVQEIVNSNNSLPFKLVNQLKRQGIIEEGNRHGSHS